MTFFFVLDGQRRVVRATRQEWETFPDEELVVAETHLPAATVTTFFDGVADGEGAPTHLFATISQVERSWREEARYASWEEAESGHERIVTRYLEGLSRAFG